jgi:hypothetical protein
MSRAHSTANGRSLSCRLPHQIDPPNVLNRRTTFSKNVKSAASGIPNRVRRGRPLVRERTLNSICNASSAQIYPPTFSFRAVFRKIRPYKYGYTT